MLGKWPAWASPASPANTQPCPCRKSCSWKFSNCARLSLWPMHALGVLLVVATGLVLRAVDYEHEISLVLVQIDSRTGATSPKDMGRVMKAVMATMPASAGVASRVARLR